MRLQVFLSHNGVCSRRKAMAYVQQGRVAVNGEVITEPSTPVDPARDTISFDGRPVGEKGLQYILLNKPAGYVTTRSDRFASRTVLDLLPEDLRHLHPVGRLDKDTEGLLLLTNDGDVTYRLTHPGFGVNKTYEVTVAGPLRPDEQRRLEQGVVIEGKRTAPALIRVTRREKATTAFRLTIHEGRKRQIRKMLAAVGRPVKYLKRVQQGPLSLGSLKTGEFRRLTPNEIAMLGSCPTPRRKSGQRNRHVQETKR